MPYAPSKPLAIPELDRKAENSFSGLLQAQIAYLKRNGHTREVLHVLARILQEELSNSSLKTYFPRSVLHPSATEYLLRAVIATIEPSGNEYIVGNASHGANCLRSWLVKEPAPMSCPIPTWRYIDSGTRPDSHGMDLDAIKSEIATKTQNRFFNDEVRDTALLLCVQELPWTTVDLVLVTPAELGLGEDLGDGTSYKELCRVAYDEFGLDVCPPDTPIQLMRSFSEFGPPEGVLLISGPTAEEHRRFQLTWRHADSSAGELSWHWGNRIPPNTRVLFQRRFVAEE